MNKNLPALLEELYDLMDRLEELSEDDPSVSEKINVAIDKLSEACDILED